MKRHLRKITVVVSLLLIVSILEGCGAAPKVSSSEQPQYQSSSASANNQLTQTPASSASSQPAAPSSSVLAQTGNTNTYGNTP